MWRQEKRAVSLRICNRNKISQGEPPIKGDSIFLFCESTGWIVDWTHPAVDFARIEQDQTPDNVKLQVQEY